MSDFKNLFVSIAGAFLAVSVYTTFAYLYARVVTSLAVWGSQFYDDYFKLFFVVMFGLGCLGIYKLRGMTK